MIYLYKNYNYFCSFIPEYEIYKLDSARHQEETIYFVPSYKTLVL